LRVFQQGEQIEKFDLFKLKQDNKYFLLLYGISVESDHVEAVYLPLLRITLANALLAVEVPKLLIAFTTRRPFIHIEHQEEAYLSCE